MNPRRIRKQEALAKLTDLITSHKNIGVITMQPMSGSSIHQIRRDLRESNAKLVVSRNTIMRMALEQTKKKKKNVEALEQYVTGNAAFLFSDENVFQVAKYLDSNKVPAPARPGQIAPIDVLVPKMNTGVPPGTFIGELNAVGLPTRIERGTIAIPDDTVVVKAGEKVSKTLANILSRLGITPFKVGLQLDAAVSDGILIEKDGLLTDYPGMLATAHHQAVNLAARIGYVTEETANAVIGSAQSEALALLRVIVSADPNAVPEELRTLAQSAAQVQTTPSETDSADTAEDEEEEEEEVDEADLGLGSLFG